jgi:hypothetical protein
MGGDDKRKGGYKHGGPQKKHKYNPNVSSGIDAAEAPIVDTVEDGILLPRLTCLSNLFVCLRSAEQERGGDSTRWKRLHHLL